METRSSVLKDKSKAFAVRVVKLYQYLSQEKKEAIMSKRLLRARTAIGALQRALQREGEYAKLDFIHKYAIVQKECNKILYWLKLLHATTYLTIEEYNSINSDAEERMKLLTSSIRTAKANNHTLITNH